MHKQLNFGIEAGYALTISHVAIGYKHAIVAKRKFGKRHTKLTTCLKPLPLIFCETLGSINQSINQSRRWDCG
jgi:hypothetical protein